jgi:hypothetical protein
MGLKSGGSEVGQTAELGPGGGAEALRESHHVLRLPHECVEVLERRVQRSAQHAATPWSALDMQGQDGSGMHLTKCSRLQSNLQPRRERTAYPKRCRSFVLERRERSRSWLLWCTPTTAHLLHAFYSAATVPRGHSTRQKCLSGRRHLSVAVAFCCSRLSKPATPSDAGGFRGNCTGGDGCAGGGSGCDWLAPRAFPSISGLR